MSEPGQEVEIGALNIPGIEDEGEPEFQVAPMVDVLLVLLLFFMATATTEVVMQTAELSLPKAENSKESDKGAGQITINIEKLSDRLKVGDSYYTSAEELVPEIQRQKNAAESLPTYTPDRPFRALIRADENTAFSKVTEIMKACAEAGVADVTFGVSNPPDAGTAPATE